LGGPKGWGPKKKVANVEIYVIFEVFAFCGGRTKTDFKDRDPNSPYLCPLVCHHKKWQTEATMRPVAKPVNSCAESIPRLSAYSSIQTLVLQLYSMKSYIRFANMSIRVSQSTPLLAVLCLPIIPAVIL